MRILRLLRFVRAWSVQADHVGLAMLRMELEGRREGTLENLAIRGAADRDLARSGIKDLR